MLEILRNWMVDQGLDLSAANILARSLILALIIVLSLIANLLAKRFILRGLAAIIRRSATQWDDMILRKKVFNRLALLAPAIVIYMTVSIPLAGYDGVLSVVSGIVLIYIIAICILALDSFLNASLVIYKTYEISNRNSDKGIYPGF